MKTLFWASFALTVYTYIGYGALVWMILRLRGKAGRRPPAEPLSEEQWPEVTLLIAAYNEADIIEAKIANSRALDYPEGRLHLLIVADGSNDETIAIAACYPEVRLLYQPVRQGKMAAVKRAMAYVKTPVTVFSDANAMLNPEAIRRLVAPFGDPRTGAVAGEKRILISAADPANAAGEGIYWKYESFLKRMDSKLGSVVGAAGELYAVRTKLFQMLPDDTVLDDFCQTLRIAMDGHHVRYSPDVCALETASASVAEELKRKTRICSGGFQAIWRLRSLLNPFRYGLLSWQYISHRVLRWTLAPLCLPLLLLSNIALALRGGAPVYQLLLCGQLLFYLLGAAGYFLRDKQVHVPGFQAPFYFLMMNYSVFAGFWRFLRRRQDAAWEKAKRLEMKSNPTPGT